MRSIDVTRSSCAHSGRTATTYQVREIDSLPASLTEHFPNVTEYEVMV